MAQAKVVKSRRGNDLVVVTMGPKEAAKVSAVLANAPWDENLESVALALDEARYATGNIKQASLSVNIE